MLRRLRIAALVFCAIAVVALTALWWRSYQRQDYCRGHLFSRRCFIGNSEFGRVTFSTWYYLNSALGAGWNWGSNKVKTSDWEREGEPIQKFVFQFYIDSSQMPLPGSLRKRALTQVSGYSLFVMVPHWFLIAVAGTIFALLQFLRQWRFTVRGLLALMTFVAIVLAIARETERRDKAPITPSVGGRAANTR